MNLQDHTTELSEFYDRLTSASTENFSSTLSATPDGSASVSQRVSNPSFSTVNTSQSSVSSQWEVLSTDDNLTEEMKLLLQKELQQLSECDETGGDSCDNNYTDSRLESGCLWIRIYDFAGQPLYYNSHFSFMVDRGIYLIVHNLKDDLNTRTVVQVGRDSQNYSIPQETSYTNLEYIKNWASAVSATCPVLSEQTTKSIFLVVGTHYDEIRKLHQSIGDRMQFLTAREQLIRHEIESAPLSRHFCEPFFYIDNTQSHDEDKAELDALRSKIVELAESDWQDGECKLGSEVSLPYSWLRFEVELYQEAAVNPRPYLLYDEAIERASQCLNKRYSVDEVTAQCNSMLEFYDRLGVLMWFQSEGLKNYVLIDPQRVLNLFKRVISLEPHFSKQQTMKDFWEKLRRSGVIERQDLNLMLNDAVTKENELMVERRKNMGLTAELPAGSDKSDERKEFFFLMLQRFYLLVPYITKSKSYHSTGCYRRLLIPSMITWNPPLHMFCVYPSDAPSILLSSSHQIVPDALFNRLVAFCVWRYPLCPQVYRYFARLHVDENHDLLLFNRTVESEHESGKIKLVMHRLDDKSKMTDPNLCSQALRYVVDSIAEVRNQRMHGLRFTLQGEIIQDGYETVKPVFNGNCRHCQESCGEAECIDHIAQHLSESVENGQITNKVHNGCQARVTSAFAQRLWFCRWLHQEKANCAPTITEAGVQPDDVDDTIKVLSNSDSKFIDKKDEQHYKVVIDSRLDLSCLLEEDGCVYQYQWFRAGTPLQNENKHFYRIDKFQKGTHSGIYTCKVTCMDEMKFYGPLLLQAKPKRDHKLCCSIKAVVHVDGKLIQRRKSVSLGHCFRMRVEIEPSEMAKSEGLRLQYKWQQNGKDIPNATNKELCIEHVQDFHEGVYRCQILEEGISNDDESDEYSENFELHMASPDWHEDPHWRDQAKLYRQKQDRVQSRKDDTDCRQATDKVALLIGNFKYEKMPILISPENDVARISSLLKQLGFKVLTYVNLNFFDMIHVLRMFCEMIHNGVYALMYFAGHGIEYNNETYILPIDGDDIQQPIVGFRERAIEYEMQMREARLSVLLLDCCRTRPRSSLGKCRCSLPSLGIGSLITHYSCCSMQSAYEPRPRSQPNTSICSNYANQLIKSLQELKESKDYQTVLDVFTKVNEEVGKQRKAMQSMVWQVPQRRDHIVENLSLADEVNASSKPARENTQIIKKVYSPISSVFEYISGFRVELHCAHWLCNVLLIGARILHRDGHDAGIELQFCSCGDEIGIESTKLDIDEYKMVHETLENCQSVAALAKCRHFRKVSNIQLATSNLLPIELHIDGIGQKSFNFDISSVTDYTRSSYQHGKKIKACDSHCCPV